MCHDSASRVRACIDKDDCNTSEMLVEAAGMDAQEAEVYAHHIISGHSIHLSLYTAKCKYHPDKPMTGLCTLPSAPTFLPPSFRFTRHHSPTSRSQMNCQSTPTQLWWHGRSS